MIRDKSGRIFLVTVARKTEAALFTHTA